MLDKGSYSTNMKARKWVHGKLEEKVYLQESLVLPNDLSLILSHNTTHKLHLNYICYFCSSNIFQNQLKFDMGTCWGSFRKKADPTAPSTTSIQNPPSSGAEFMLELIS